MKKHTKLLVLLLTLLFLSACGKPAPQAPETENTSTVPETTAVPAPAPLPSIQEGDTVLMTLDAAPEDGRLLRLYVLGKTTEYFAGVREIQVFEGNTLLQSILIQEAIALDGVDGIDIGYSQAAAPETAAALRDVNFDGCPDLEVTAWLPNNAIPYYYWCWNPETSRFQYAFTLPLRETDPEKQLLVAWYKVENGLYHTDYYQVDNQNTLHLVYQETEDLRPN